nr:pyridoxal-phosphate dependent enzyme [Micromonospora purpureochromogenes]
MTPHLAASAEDVYAAAKRIAGVAHRTPVLTSRTLDLQVGATVFLKCENFQRAGSFKFRGAYNAIARLDNDSRRRGVVVFSSGNHAQAVACAARILGSRAVVVMPADTPPSKVTATAGYGAEIVTFDRYTDDRFTISDRLAAERGLTLIPPYDHADVIAGAGTTAVELWDDIDDLDALIVPLGGGGHLAGCATVLRTIAPTTRLVGVETEAGDKNRRSVRAGRPVFIPVPRTIADGVTGERTGLLTFPIIQRLVDEVVVVSDEEILTAMTFLSDRMKLVVEPSGALAVAALLAGRVRITRQRVGVILSGGNISADLFSDLFTGTARRR